MRSAEWPWGGVGETGKVVLGWEWGTVQVEEGGVGAGELWDTEVGSGHHGMTVSGEVGGVRVMGWKRWGARGYGKRQATAP